MCIFRKDAHGLIFQRETGATLPRKRPDIGNQACFESCGRYYSIWLFCHAGGAMANAQGMDDRRRDPRRGVRILALVKIGANLYGRGYTRDISLTGVCLESVSIFKLIRPARAYDLKGASVSVRATHPSLSLQGKVVRVDPYKGEIGIALIEGVNGAVWHEL